MHSSISSTFPHKLKHLCKTTESHCNYFILLLSVQRTRTSVSHPALQGSIFVWLLSCIILCLCWLVAWLRKFYIGRQQRRLTLTWPPCLPYLQLPPARSQAAAQRPKSEGKWLWMFHVKKCLLKNCQFDNFFLFSNLKFFLIFNSQLEKALFITNQDDV